MRSRNPLVVSAPFSISLPPPSSGPRSKRDGRDSLPPPPPVRRVVVIDSDGERADVLTKLLRAAGHDAFGLPADDDVLDRIFGASADLLLIETSGTGSFGMRLCSDIRRFDHAHATPIVLYAHGGSDEPHVVSGFQNGADDFIADASRTAELTARVEVQLRNLRDREILRWAHEQRLTYRAAALIDPLTGMPNRRAIDRALSQTLRGSKRTIVMMLDIDHFKAVNDTWGHAVGDEVLRCVGVTLTSRTRREDLVGRVGGEEFAAILRDAGLENGLAIGERYRQSIRSLVFPPGLGPQRITVSVGIACWEESSGETSPAALFARADEALYEAKRAGRDRVRVVDVPPRVVESRRRQA